MAETIGIVNGKLIVTGIADGGLTSFDLVVGKKTTPDYGLIQMGDSCMGRTSYKAGSLDLDGAFISRNMGGPVTGQIEFVWTESSGGQVIRFALPKSGVGNATYNPRSLLLAGPAVNDDDIVTVGYWQTQGLFHNLACDTAGPGADLGVQNDLEVEGDIFADSIKESTTNAGITFGSGTKLGFYGTTPASQPAHIADADGTLADITTKFNALLAQIAATGLQAAS